MPAETYASHRKSQIALEYCFRKRHQEPTCSVFWVSAATTARFEESFQRMARECGLGNRIEGQDESIVLVQRWLEAEYVDPWIMVIDNVDDEAAFFREKCRNGKSPSQCLPHCSHGLLLFTSRTRDVAVDLAGPAMPIGVDSITTQEGLELMRKRLGPGPPEAHLIELLLELEYIPLAVTQAISFIVKRRKSVQQYLELYRMSDHSRNRLLSYEFLDHGRYEQTMDSVARTWALSFEWIRRQHPKAAEMLCLMSFYQHSGVPVQLLRYEDEDTFEFEDSIAVLQAFSLLHVNESGTTYDTHRLVQATTKWWLEQEGSEQLEKWALRALEVVTLRFPPPIHDPTGDYWEDCRSLLPHADILLQQTFKIAMRESDLVKARLLVHTGRYLAWMEMGDWQDVQRHFQESVVTRQKHLGLKHVDTLTSMGFLFWSLSAGHDRLPDFDSRRTVALGYELLELRREILGPRHPDTVDGLSDLAGLLDSLGNLEKSEAMQREAFTLSDEVNGHTHINTIYCMDHLAKVLGSMGKYAEALELETKAVTMSTKVLGPEHRSVLAERSNLAGYLENTGRVDESVREYREVLALAEKVYGSNNRNTWTTARNLAILLADEHRYKEAVDVLSHALSSLQVDRRSDLGLVDLVSPQAIEELKLQYELAGRVE